MSLFAKKEENVGDAKADKQKEEAKKISPAVAAKKKTADAVGSISETATEVLVEPWITEKSHEKMAEHKYIFKVASKARKGNVKKAIEELYKVVVVKVNIINIPAKQRSIGAKIGWKSGYKKAIATLKKGDKIKLFEGV